MSLTAVSFGEILWDVFPSHKKIGGAPLNVALRLQSFGIDTHIISGIGDDKLGSDILKYLNKTDLNIDSIQKLDSNTGQVLVTLDTSGSATYDIEFPAAWDSIQLQKEDIEKVSNSNVFVYGSLSSRNETSKQTLIELQKHSNFKVFDVNLRPPFYNKILLKELLFSADLIKFNDEELEEICTLFSLNFENTIESQVKAMIDYTKASKICVTRGAEGAVLFADNKFYYNHGVPTVVVDTVGAGDSFLASLIYKLLINTPYQESIDFACKIGSIVAGKEGANPTIDYTSI